ncbi:MAG: L-threonylcarbamoyladenylate synthase [Planctomycetota bacterium]
MKARIVQASLDAEGLAHIDEAARLLAEGRLVAFPTETVYGIGCHADDEAAMARLLEVKQRPPEKPFSIHIGRIDDLARHVERVPPMAEKLILRYWPGPLTIVFPTGDSRGLGVRMPSNQIALELLRRTPVPVVAPSANRSGRPPAKTAQEVASAFGNELDLILDGGPTTLKEASTVLRLADDDWEILRQGSVTLDMIRRTLGTTIIFVCTANSCRSPMAEVLCKQALAEKLHCPIDRLPERGYCVLSAGTAAGWHHGASEQAVAAMRRRGLDLSDHQSRALTPGMIEDADVLFVMARHHADSIRRIMPESEAKIAMLDPQGRDIPDPVGASVETFVACADRLDQYIRRHLETL